MTTDGDTAAEADLKVKEKQTVEKRQEMLKSLQNQVDKVDRNVTDLAKSFDSLFDDLCKRSEELRQDIASRDQEKDEDGSQIPTQTQENLSYLVQTAKTVAENKVQALWSLSKLIHFIHADSEEICTDRALKKCKALDIDNYLKRDHPSSDKNGESLVELLEEQNKRLQEKYKLARDHVKIVSEREQIVNDDRDLLRKRLKKLESKNKECDDDHFAMRVKADVSDGDVDSGSYSYIRKDADGVSSSPTYSSDLTTQSTKTSIHEIKVLGKCGVQTSDSEESFGEDIENRMAVRRITELQSELQSVQTKLKDKEQLLQSVVCRAFYEVTMVHHNANRRQKIELDLITEMNKAMEKLKYGLNVNKASFPRTVKQGQVIIMTCLREPRNRSWEAALSFAAASDSVTSKMLLVVFYEISDKAELELAMERKFDSLEKFGRVLTFRCSNGILFTNQKEMGSLIQFLMTNGNGQNEVVGCCNCKKQSSFY